MKSRSSSRTSRTLIPDTSHARAFVEEKAEASHRLTTKEALSSSQALSFICSKPFQSMFWSNSATVRQRPGLLKWPTSLKTAPSSHRTSSWTSTRSGVRSTAFISLTLREGRMPGLRRITIYACSSLSHVTRGTMVPAVWCRPKSCKGGIDRTKCFRGQRHSMGVAWKVHEYVTTACRSRGYLLRKYLLGMSMQISSYYHDGVVRVHWPIISSWAHSEIYVHFAEGKWSAIVF